MLKPLFYTRSFSAVYPVGALNPFQADAWLSVSFARWKAEGGPDIATLAGINAGRIDLARALTLLRCPVDLVDEAGIPAWWGYVSAVELRTGAVSSPNAGVSIRADLEAMANRVKASYSRLPLESNQWTAQQVETDWYDDLNSQAMYGVKEAVIHLNDSTAVQAAAACGLALSDFGWPIAVPFRVKETHTCPGGQCQGDFASLLITPTHSSDQAATVPNVVITLRGWWGTLGWKYYAQTEGLIENLYEGPGTQLMGGSSEDASVFQSFTVEDPAPGGVANGGWRAQQAWLKAALRGNPNDSMQVDICQDSWGEPGSSLASAAVGHGEFTNTFSWHCFEFDSPPSLDAGTYWLWVHRTGATHGSNSYILKVDEYESYAGGECRVNGTPRSPAADLLFRIAGGMETTAQLAAMADLGGQFLQGVRLEAASGVYTNPFRAGNLTALQEITNHLRAGNADSVRLQAEVTPDRYLRVWLKPEASTAGISITNEGALADLAGNRLPAWTPAAGRWAVVRGAWGESGSEYQQVKDRVLLETVVYDPVSGGLRAG